MNNQQKIITDSPLNFSNGEFKFASMRHQDLPPEIEVYEIGERRLYVKNGVRSVAFFEDDLTPEELVGIAKDISVRQGTTSSAQPDMTILGVAA